MTPEQVAKPSGQPVSSPATSQSVGASEPQGGVIPSNATIAPKAEDLIKRMGTTGSQNNPNTDTPPSLDPSDLGYDPRKIEEIKDPQARQLVEELKKSLERGYNNKFMKLANEKKEVENLRTQLEAQTNQPWTPERVQQLLRDPNFAQAASAVQQSAPPADWSGSQEEWSTLTPNEKRQFSELRNAVSQQQMQLNRMLISSEEQKIKDKYPDYDPQNVEKWYKDAAEGRIPEGQIRELIHKALNFEKYVEGGYKFGLEDRNVMLREKAGAMSPNHVNTQTVTDVPKRAEGESSRSLFAKLAKMRLANNQK
jgi:hypothetical protein